MVMASPESSSSLRSWWTIVAGVAVASSALTTVSILGVQRLNRKHRRQELEDDIRKATQRQSTVKDEKGIKGEKDNNNSSSSDTVVPKYLTALAAAQNESSSRSQPSRPTTPAGGAGSSAAHFHGLTRKPSFQMRPSLSSSSSSRKELNSTTNPSTYDESLIREQLSRNYSFLGEEAMSQVRDAFVVVVGAGGVGSWCALMLLRSGVGKIRLIDFDQVSLSSLNRHACANLADVGRPKVIVCKEHFANIAPWTEVDAQVEIFRGSDAPRLLGAWKDDGTRPFYVVDAIDNLDTKIDLLAYCYQHKIKCFSSMGAGAKADPSQMQIADLNTTAEDPLARRVRRGLRAKGIWGAGAVWGKKKGGKQGKARVEQNGKDVPDDSVDSPDAKLQSNRPSTNSSGPVLQSSGRGAEEKPSTNPSNSTTKSANEAGFSRYTSSRRTSSVSSMGSAQFFSPVSTPEEGEGPKELKADEALDDNVEAFSLPDAQQVEEKGGGETNEGNTKDTSPHRPPLSTLTAGRNSESGPSRRTSSLKELVAEDTRSSQSGKLAKRTVSGISVMREVEEAVGEEDEGDEGEERGEDVEKPFTIMCVYSNEKSDTRLLPLDEDEYQKGKVEELAALEDFRVRILPVLGPLPAIFGLAAATYVLCDISGRELETIPWKNRKKTYERIWTDLESVERHYPVSGSGHDSKDVATGPRRIPWSIDDVGYLYEEVFRARSIVPPYETLSTARLLRWDSTLPLSYSNVALFTRIQGKRHEQEVLKQGKSPVEVWGDETYRMFKLRMAEERRMNILR